MDEGNLSKETRVASLPARRLIPQRGVCVFWPRENWGEMFPRPPPPIFARRDCGRIPSKLFVRTRMLVTHQGCVTSRFGHNCNYVVCLATLGTKQTCIFHKQSDILGKYSSAPLQESKLRPYDYYSSDALQLN